MPTKPKTPTPPPATPSDTVPDPVPDPIPEGFIRATDENPSPSLSPNASPSPPPATIGTTEKGGPQLFNIMDLEQARRELAALTQPSKGSKPPTMAELHAAQDRVKVALLLAHSRDLKDSDPAYSRYLETAAYRMHAKRFEPLRLPATVPSASPAPSAAAAATTTTFDATTLPLAGLTPEQQQAFKARTAALTSQLNP